VINVKNTNSSLSQFLETLVCHCGGVSVGHLFVYIEVTNFSSFFSNKGG
jgi:hypothetical protein